MRTGVSGRLALLGAAIVFAGAVAQAQGAGRTVWDGVYTSEQADRGKAAYAANCASCHGATLSGIDVAPALTGAAFLNNWNNTTAGDLFDRIHTTMPQNAPGSLGAKTVSDIEAYIIQANGMPAGQTALPPTGQMMGGIKIVAQKPAG